jgi:hypothetical protein
MAGIGWQPTEVLGQDITQARMNALGHPSECPCSICDPNGTANITEYERLLYQKDKPHPVRCFCSTCRPHMNYHYYSEFF